MSGNGRDGVSAETLRSISTPDRVESRLGTLEFRDGAPTKATAELLYDHLDFVHGMEAFINAFPGASLAAIRQGFLDIGVEDNSVLLFSELMDSASLFLTANCDTLYFLSFIDLTGGPMVLDVPPLGAPSGILGTIDDMWFRWVTDFGVPGPDRAQGGRYLIVGPGYDGPLPDSGFHVSRARTTRVIVLGRVFMIDNDPRPGSRGDPPRSPHLPVPARSPGHGGRDLPRRRRSPSPSPCCRCPRPGSSRAPAGRSTRSRRTTSATGTPSTPWCSRNRPGPVTPRRWACSPPSGSSTESRSSPTPGCARSSRTPSPSATPPPAPSPSRRGRRKASPTTPARPGSTCCSPAAMTSSTRPRRSPPTAPSPARATAPASSTRASRSSTPTPASPPPCACGSPASAPSTSWPCATAAGTTSTAPAATG